MKARRKKSNLNNSMAKHMETVGPYQDQVWSCVSFFFDLGVVVLVCASEK
jgi:hypothetical protein